MRVCLLWLVSVFLVLNCKSQFVTNAGVQSVPNQYVVSFTEASLGPQRAAHIANVRILLLGAASIIRTYDFTGAAVGYLLNEPDSNSLALAFIAGSAEVSLIEPNQIAQPVAGHHQCEIDNVTNDWNLDRLDTHPLDYDGKYEHFVESGDRITVWLFDMGVDLTHPEISRNVEMIPAANNYIGKNGGIDYSGNGHGTAVAGVLVEVAHNVTIISLACTTLDECIRAHEYVYVTLRPRNIPTFTLKFDMALNANENALEYLARTMKDKHNHVFYVVAAGNDDVDARNASPGRVEPLCTIAASNSADVRWASSNWGPRIDLFGMGEGIRVMTHGGAIGERVIMDGTSLGAAHVSGKAAVYWSHYYGKSGKFLKHWVVVDATPDVLSDVKGSPNLLIYGCPCATASVHGDPHFSTWGNIQHDFMGRCSYHYVTHCNRQKVDTWAPFEVIGTHTECNSLTCIKSVSVRIFTYPVMTIKLSKLHDFEISYAKSRKMDEKAFDVSTHRATEELFLLPIKMGSKDGFVGIEVMNGRTILKLSTGEKECGIDMVIKLSQKGHAVKVDLSDCYINRVCGLIGAFGAQVDKELQHRDGFVPKYKLKSDGHLYQTNKKVIKHFGDSWVVKPQLLGDTPLNKCSDYQYSIRCRQDKIFAKKIRDACENLVSQYTACCNHLGSPFKCKHIVNHCVIDACACKGELKECLSLPKESLEHLCKEVEHDPFGNSPAV